ncbi:MAG: hypothetical protein EBT18_05930 [Gammaproteobacteria bacterium]|nr:hypothetical protein [Gammaproteobacteria bacterium]
MRYPGGGYRTDPFVDLLFNALLGFTLLFFVTLVYFNPEARKGKVNLKAEYIISVTWPENRTDDIDLWVRDPLGKVVSYIEKDAGWLHLDRDDQGSINDTVVIEGKEVIFPINQELVTLRGLIDGEYTVNLYYYEKRDLDPVEILVKIERINPSVETVFVKKVTMSRVDEEITVVRFTPTRDGRIINVNNRPLRLTPYLLDPLL